MFFIERGWYSLNRDHKAAWSEKSYDDINDRPTVMPPSWGRLSNISRWRQGYRGFYTIFPENHQMHGAGRTMYHDGDMWKWRFCRLFFSENGMWLLISWLQPKIFASLVLDFLTHWGQLVYICVNEPKKNGSGNGLTPASAQALNETFLIYQYDQQEKKIQWNLNKKMPSTK